MALSRMLINKDGYPSLATYDNKTVVFEDNWVENLIGFTKDDITDGALASFIALIAIILVIV